MAKAINRLSQAFVNKTATPGDYCDGNGLYLQITKNGVKSWLFRYMRQGRARYMGLGPLHTIGLADARTRALECRRLLLDGIDPLDAKQKERAADDTAKAKAMTFDGRDALLYRRSRIIRQAAYWGRGYRSCDEGARTDLVRQD